MRYRPGYCSHIDCFGKPEQLLGSRIKRLCLLHNNQRLKEKRIDKKPKAFRKLKKRNYAKADKKRGVKSTLIDKLDAVFSLYIRNKYAIDGYVCCYTCPRNMLVSQMQCGHFQGRANHVVRWNQSNARPQCPRCNEYLGGMKKYFRERLVSELGEDEVQRIEFLSKSASHFNKIAIMELIQYYKKKLEDLLK